MSVEFLGIVKVPILRLQFLEVHEGYCGREYRSRQAIRQTERLARLFSGTQIEDENPRHHIEGYIDHSAVQSVLDRLGLSAPKLQELNLDTIYPRLDDHVVLYTQGRHRITAAKTVDPTQCWTVILSHVVITDLHENKSIKRRTEQYQYERAHSDGQIYAKLRGHQLGDFDHCSWLERLTPHKQEALESINKHPPIAAALNMLADFPGVIDFLHLGTWHKFFSSRLHTELEHALHYTFKEISRYTLDSQFLQRCYTRETAEMLEGRAPGTSQSDREWIHEAFQSHRAFPGVTDLRQREDLECRVQATSGLIPGLRSLQANMMFLGLAAEAIWSHVMPAAARKAKKERQPLRATLREHWVPLDPCVEVQEGVFQPVLGGSFDLAYNQLILAALRQFPYLTSTRPMLAPGEKFRPSFDPNCESLFHRRAALLGFRSSCIEKGIHASATAFRPHTIPDEINMVALDEAKFLRQMNRRWGRPWNRTFPIVQASAFLPDLDRAGNEVVEINAIFLIQNIFKAFLEPCEFQYDYSRQRICINESSVAVQDSKCQSCQGPLRSNVVETLYNHHTDETTFTINPNIGREALSSGTMGANLSVRNALQSQPEDNDISMQNAPQLQPSISTRELLAKATDSRSTPPSLDDQASTRDVSHRDEASSRSLHREFSAPCQPSDLLHRAHRGPSSVSTCSRGTEPPVERSPARFSRCKAAGVDKADPALALSQTRHHDKPKRIKVDRRWQLRRPRIRQRDARASESTDSEARPANNPWPTTSNSSPRSTVPSPPSCRLAHLHLSSCSPSPQGEAQYEGTVSRRQSRFEHSSTSTPRSTVPTPRWSHRCSNPSEPPLPVSQAPLYMERSLSPRSGCGTPAVGSSCASGSPAAGAQLGILKQGVIHNMQALLAVVPRDGEPSRPPSTWQGFIDSDSDMESIDIE